MNIKLPPVGLKGIMRMVVSKDAEMKEVTHDTGEFPNLITNVGLNRIGEVNADSSTASTTFGQLCGRFVVGSGQTPPSFTDTALQAPVAFASRNSDAVSESSSYERGWYELTVMHQFEPGQAAGNLAEIGIQNSSASGPLWSRALILDGNGNPTTITVLADDFLTCYYTLRIMIPQEDAVFNINVDYDGELVPTVVTARPLNADSSSSSQGWGLKSVGTSGVPARLFFYTGGLAAPTASAPLGNTVGTYTASASVVPYVADSYQRYVTITSGLKDHNGETLRTARLNPLMGCWQIEFDPPLEKDNTQEMQYTFGYSWARA